MVCDPLDRPTFVSEDADIECRHLVTSLLDRIKDLGTNRERFAVDRQAEMLASTRGMDPRAQRNVAYQNFIGELEE